MYYTDKPNVFPQEKLKIPYNILFILKTSIFTLYKVYIWVFIHTNCQKKNNSNELSFLWLNPIYTFCNTNFQPIHYHFFLLKVCQNIQTIPESSFACGFPINKTFHFASPSTSIIEYSESAYKSWLFLFLWFFTLQKWLCIPH